VKEWEQDRQRERNKEEERGKNKEEEREVERVTEVKKSIWWWNLDNSG
jgi:hypothetical protein